jgi:hypothetical protein
VPNCPKHGVVLSVDWPAEDEQGEAKNADAAE